MVPTPLTPLRLAQITDMHLLSEDNGELHGVNTGRAFRRVLAQVASLEPDLLLVTGDIAEHGDESVYRRLQEDLAPFPRRMVLPGNHDLGDGYPRFFNNDPVQVHSLGGWTLLGVNSAGEYLTGEQKARCLDVLDQADRVLLILHHPLVKLGRALFDEVWIIKNRDEFYGALRNHPSLRGVVFGHTHAVHRIEDGPVRHLGAPATSFYLEAHPTEHRFEMIVRHGFQMIELGDTVQASAHFLDG